MIKNNIGQILSDLITYYKFYYLGLTSKEQDFVKYKHTIELNLILSDKHDFQINQNEAKSFLSLNYSKDIVEIINYELIEINQILFLMDQRNKGFSKDQVEDKLCKNKINLNRKNLPQLIELVEQNIGNLILAKHILSVNAARRCLVHRNGIVDRDNLELITYTPKIFTTNIFTDINYKGKEEDTKIVDYIKEWKLNTKIHLEYEDCFRIQFTVLLFFNEIVNKIYAKHPDLKITEGKA